MNEIGISAENKVRIQDSHLIKRLQRLLLSLIPHLNGRVVVLGPVEFVLDGTHCDQPLDAVLLGELSSGLNEAILVRGAGKVIMSEIDDVLRSFEGEI